jgi:hypothetical protein
MPLAHQPNFKELDMYGPMKTLLGVLDEDEITALNVLEWGCPVPFFGHLDSACIGTVGINPSNREFIGLDGQELVEAAQRLPTLKSLGLSAWSEADYAALESIVSACCGYFERNPYDGWFGSLQRIIEPTGHSYYPPRSDACHLDVVPWATNGKWGTLAGKIRKQLVEQAAEALVGMIACSPLKLLILNGQEVVRQFEILMGYPLYAQRVPAWDLPRRSGRPVPGVAYRARVSSIGGTTLGRELLVLGYNHNLQSSFGVTTEVRNSIGEWITAQYRTTSDT